MGARHLTIEERQKIFECFDAGMSLNQTSEAVGRGHSTVACVKRDWKAKKELDKLNEAIVEPAVEEPTKANSDYAKAYLSGDPRWGNSSLEVKKLIKIESSKTGFTYKRVAGSESISITNDNGQSIEVSMKFFEAFTDEVVDVYIEMCEFDKKK